MEILSLGSHRRFFPPRLYNSLLSEFNKMLYPCTLTPFIREDYLFCTWGQGQSQSPADMILPDGARITARPTEFSEPSRR